MKDILAESLLDIEAVTLSPNEPFTWSSGLKSPIYCDNRLTLAYPELRKKIAKTMAKEMDNEVGKDYIDVVVGTATAGIPHAAWVSDQLEKPLAYVRSSAKAHGKGKRIEGKVASGDRVVVVEDLLSTGGSALDAVEELRSQGAIVQGVYAIFSYQLAVAGEAFEEKKVRYTVLSDYQSLIEVAKNRGDLNEQDVTALKEWREDPSMWSKKWE
ncbi:orotate phosphoribosyltransferase [Texcoconibacillus texcoconensis]|uniref:Orotate phosphoribosyltransferase n=1 Tax=Texcoconibacillus texcoconensis TaxID=1095777 RepID=A0A840QLA2_9BACI|nr:orotate phosphoribosyltransferase [Texcoconibacillus texcoconensis]